MRLISMIQRCIDRMRAGACATCDHKERCAAARWQQGLAFAGAAGGPSRPGPSAPSAPSPFLAFLGEIGKLAERTAKPRAPSFRSQVEARLEPLLDGGDVGIDRIAAELGLSRQTLYRRLKGEGLTFEQVLDGLRHRLALRYLGEQGMSVKQVAYRLGFSDPAAFSRAFKRWTGRSPSDFRPG